MCLERQSAGCRGGVWRDAGQAARAMARLEIHTKAHGLILMSCGSIIADSGGTDAFQVLRCSLNGFTLLTFLSFCTLHALPVIRGDA